VADTTRDDIWGDEFDLESGFASEYDIKITDAYFTTDAKYNAGQNLLLCWEGEAYEPDGTYSTPMMITEEDGNIVRPMFPVGAEWTTTDDGKTAFKAGKTTFNKNSIYGRILARLREIPGGGLLAQQANAMGAGPRTAAIWVGLKVHLKSEDIEFKGLTTSTRLMPVEVYGVEGGVGATASAPKAAAKPAAAAPEDQVAAKRQAALDRVAAAKAAKAAASTNGKPAHVVALEELAKKSPSHDEFIKPALDIDGVLDDEALVDTLMNEGAEGFFATHH
jgi:hypothetical protein